MPPHHFLIRLNATSTFWADDLRASLGEGPMQTANEFRKLAAWYERCARFMAAPADREMRLRYADHFRKIAESPLSPSDTDGEDGDFCAA